MIPSRTGIGCVVNTYSLEKNAKKREKNLSHVNVWFRPYMTDHQFGFLTGQLVRHHFS